MPTTNLDGSVISLKELNADDRLLPRDSVNADGYTVWHDERGIDHACSHAALGILGLNGLLGLTTLIGGACLLQSIASRPFSDCLILRGVGLSATIFGVFVLVGVAVVGWMIHTGADLSRYGACLFPQSQPLSTKIRRVVTTGIIPLVVAVIAMALSIGSIALYTLSITAPSLDRDYHEIQGLKGPVRLVRDESGLTHIHASSRGDAYFGQGFAEAQDRLWQLEFLRLAGRGRLGEYVGSAGVKMDKQTRALNIVGAAVKLCSNITQTQRGLIENFVDGINYYLDTVNERPPEFLFMSKRLLYFHEPEPFTVDDVCLYARLLQWQLSFNVALEVQRFKIFWKTNRSYDEIEELYVNQTNISHTILSSAQLNLTEADAVAARAREAHDHDIERHLYNTYMSELRSKSWANADSQAVTVSAASKYRRRGLLSSPNASSQPEWDFLRWKAVHASNAWASNAVTPSSKACGASDPHLDINLPSVWYYSHLRYPFADDGSDNRTFDTAGVGMVGVPGVHIGKTTFVSWGITMSLTDLEDLFLLQPDPQNPQTHYMVNGTSLAFGVRQEVIHVKGEDDIVLEVQDSIYGPVVTEAFELPRPLKFAIMAQPLLNDDTSVTSVLNLGDPLQVRNAAELRDNAFGLMRSPGFSIPIADHEGNIGYTMTGAHVVRAVGHTGKYPTIGNGSFDYIGEIPFIELPTLMLTPDVPSSPLMISAANQKTYPDGYAYTLGYDFTYPFRGGRIQTLLAANPTQLSTRSFHRSVQSDLHSNVWVEMQSFINSSQAFRTALTPAGQQWLSLMSSEWDGRSTIGSGFPSFLFLWIRALSAVPSDVTSAVDTDYWSPGDNYPFFMLAAPTKLMLRQCASLLSADANKLGGAYCTALAAQEWNALSATYASPADAPKWGVDLNVLTGQHLMMHGTILACMFERSIHKDGDYSTIDVSDFASEIQGSMSPDAASSMRQLYDWSESGTVWFALPGGDSGNPYTDRYDNLMNAFSADEYVVVQVSNGSIVESHAQYLSPLPSEN